ncbi:MAG TPA: GNAT family N-acetyltransferase [Candidatus Kryptonia bacterium]|nr:GNAT family N-acetyltransferase [Candidatus Kryptonia bacterium]
MTSNDPVVIRRAEARDAAALGGLGAALVRAHHAFDPCRFLTPGPRLEEGYAHFLGTQLADEDVAVFVAERDGTIIGYVYAGVEPRSWKELRDAAGFIHDVVVDPDARGTGIGTRLIETAAAWLVTRGVPRVMLWTAEKNQDAQRLFEQLGFRRTMVEMTRESPVSTADERR